MNASPKRTSPDEVARPALFDLILDPESFHGYDGDKILATIRRDLDYLLNTKRPSFRQLGLSDEVADELRHSVLGFGLTDYKTPRDNGTGVREMTPGEIAEHIRATIEAFEPRLRDVRVETTELDELRRARPGDVEALAVGLQIFGELAQEPFGQVAFNTIVELTRGRTLVESPAEDAPADEQPAD